MMRCFCGCGYGHPFFQRHHVIYQQELRRLAKQLDTRPDLLMADWRNLVVVGEQCHATHHNRQKPYELRRLPDSAYEFAVEVMNSGQAYEYLRRRYSGDDPRLDALITGEQEAA